MNRQTAEHLAELSMPYRDKEPGEQEYELAVSLVRIGEITPAPDLGPKDFWLRVRDNLAEKLIEQRVAVETTGVAAAGQVLAWASSNSLDAAIYQLPLAILTAMVIRSVIDAMGGGDEHDRGPHHE